MQLLAPGRVVDDRFVRQGHRGDPVRGERLRLGLLLGGFCFGLLRGLRFGGLGIGLPGVRLHGAGLLAGQTPRGRRSHREQPEHRSQKRGGSLAAPITEETAGRFPAASTTRSVA